MTFFRFAVLHGDVRDRSDDEADRDEPQVVLPGRLEHFRFHHRGPFAARARSGGRSGIVSITFIPFGKYYRTTVRPPLCCVLSVFQPEVMILSRVPALGDDEWGSPDLCQ